MNYDFPTPQGPTQRKFRSLVTPEEQDELAARRSVHAGMLPTNLAHAQYANFSTMGGSNLWSPEQEMFGWTAQQPFAHVDCDVMHLCVYCAKMLDPDLLRKHDCKVRNELSR